MLLYLPIPIKLQLCLPYKDKHIACVLLGREDEEGKVTASYVFFPAKSYIVVPIIIIIFFLLSLRQSVSLQCCLSLLFISSVVNILITLAADINYTLQHTRTFGISIHSNFRCLSARMHDSKNKDNFGEKAYPVSSQHSEAHPRKVNVNRFSDMLQSRGLSSFKKLHVYFIRKMCLMHSPSICIVNYVVKVNLY